MPWCHDFLMMMSLAHDEYTLFSACRNLYGVRRHAEALGPERPVYSARVSHRHCCSRHLQLATCFACRR